GILRARPTRLEHGGVFLKISTKGLYENFHLGCANEFPSPGSPIPSSNSATTKPTILALRGFGKASNTNLTATALNLLYFSTMARIISGSENVAAELSKMNFASK
ncbi:hypothetical protein F441_00773, partial [Phytophthora nicotianae CJ01A1]